MTEEQYKKICEACDNVLLLPDSTIERVAIPWLHVIREHPLILSNYLEIFEHTNGIKELSRKLLGKLRHDAMSIKQIIKSLFFDGNFWYASTPPAKNVDILFVSHFINQAHAGQNTDFYFGSLPDELVMQGYSVAIALINHSKESGEVLVRKWKGSMVPRLMLSESIGYSEEMILHKRLKNESFRLKKLEKIQPKGFVKNILARASKEALSNGTLSNLRFSRQIGSLVGMLNPSSIVTTHEGHAWERILFATARNVSQKVLCVGYQHAAVFRLQHAIRRSLSAKYNPDYIFTAGPVGKKQLEISPWLKEIPISVLGSNRNLQTDKFELSGTRAPLFNGRLQNLACLVIPEGILTECNFLFEFSLRCAQLCPEIQFIWRLHPAINSETFGKSNIMFLKLPENIIFSRDSLEADIAKCSWALYRGTTAIIPAVVAGLRPLYLKRQGEMTIDPLYELNDWRIDINNVGDFICVIKADSTHYSLAADSGFIYAQEYCRNFYSPINISVIKSVISKNINPN